MSVHVVAEAGQCMEGDVNLAIGMARRARDAGCWGFKVQLLQPHKIAHPDAPKYWDDTLPTQTQAEAFKYAGIVDYAAWLPVKLACDHMGIEFFATPFDLEAVEALERIGVRHYKIASGDITYRQLIETVASTGKHVIISTGAANLGEIEAAVQWVGRHAPITLLACTLSYPTMDDDANLARITTLRRQFPRCAVGYSDHTLGTRTALAAAALGATMLEKHYTVRKQTSHVPDDAMALRPHEMRKYVEYAQEGAILRGHGRLEPDESELPAWRNARRSIYAARDLKTGHTLADEDVVFLRPGGHISPASWPKLRGMRLTGPVCAGEPL